MMYITEEVERGGGEPDTSARPVQERHFWRIGSVMAVFFLQIMSLNGLDQLVNKDIVVFGIYHLNEIAPLLFGSAIIGYAMLVWIGLYTDTVVGKYTMMIFGAALKTSGTCIIVAVGLIMNFASDLSMVSVKVLLVAGLVGLVFFGAGFFAFSSSLVTFGLEQVERPAAATIVRWGFWTASLAIFISSELIEYVHETSVWSVSRHAFLFIVDVLSITVLLLCKTKYTITTFEQGRKSLKGLVRAVTTIAFCRRSSDETARILQTREERCRDRLLFKKVLFLIALLSVMVIAQSMAYVLQRICLAHHGYCFHDPDELTDLYIPATQRIVAIILIPAFELFGRKLSCQGCLLWQDSAKKQLKMFGLGSLLASLALVMTGAVATAVRQSGGSENVSPFWAFPQFVTLGVAQVIICTSMVVFCLFESLPGLTTTTATLAVSLFVLGPLVELVVGIIQKDFDGDPPREVDIVLYSVGGAMVVTLVIIYLPLSMSYLKAKSELEALDIETDDEQDAVHVSGEDVQPEGQTLSRLGTHSTMSESPTRNYGSLEDFSSAGSINKDNLDELVDDE